MRLGQFNRSGIAAALLMAVLLAACSGEQPAAGLQGSALPAQPESLAQAGLPELTQLAPPQLQRSASDTVYDLLPFAPQQQSSEGVSWSPGSLVLNGALASSGQAWALYALSGFSTDGTIIPAAVSIARSKPAWLAIADFSAGRWRILSKASQGVIPFNDGASLVSPGGAFYIAVLAHENNVSVSALSVSSNLDLPGGPVALLTVPDPIYAGVSADFDASASAGGGGNIIECRYDFGDGSPVQTSSSASEPVSHVFDAPGNYTVNLQVKTDTARMGEADFIVPVGLDPSLPVAQLNLLSSRPTAEWAVSFDASGSTGGSGSITSITYNWGDGSPDTVVTEPADKVEHVYAAPGDKTVTLTVLNDLAKSSQDSQQLDCAIPMRDLLVVYNTDDPESVELKDYYMSPESGRAIDPDYVLGLPLGAAIGDTVARDDGAGGAKDYVNDIREPVKLHINGSGYKDSLKYILLLSGVPHRISGTVDLNTGTSSSVDSELCTLFEDGSYPIEGYLWNESVYQGFQQPNFSASSFFMGVENNNTRQGLDRNYSFSHGQYVLTDSSNNQYDLDYLVGRLDAYNLADAKAMVDRSLAADKSGLGWVIYDSSPGSTVYDTMADPVWPYTDDDAALCGDEVLTQVGQNHFMDLTNTRILGLESEGVPAAAIANVIAYAGWGVNHSGGSWPNGPEYILDDLQFSWLPGCAWISYESFNATDFASVDPDTDRSDITRNGQGQICDFIHMGGTVAMGHAWEPWTIAVGDERVAFYRYVVKGDRWIEAAYKAVRCMSWQDVVIGDPLCTVR
ncbi:PKD domain-containing protein [bacterium]|nr:PKD domain-containing protein [bacterium]